VAILTGFDVSFGETHDHSFGNLQVGVKVISGTPQSADVQVTLGLRDWSGNWDDKYEGTVSNRCHPTGAGMTPIEPKCLLGYAPTLAL